MNIFAIEGLIGNGKSTVVQLGKAAWGTNKLTFIEEPIMEMESGETGPSLQEFYNNMRATAFAFQKRVINLWFTSAVAGRQIAVTSLSKAIITDRSVFSPLAFSRVLLSLGHLSRGQYKELKALIIDRAVGENLIPSKMVVFSAPAKLLMERIEKRGRPGEAQITKEYINLLAREQLWLCSFLVRRFGCSVLPIAIRADTGPEEMLKTVAAHFGLTKPPIGYFRKLSAEACVPAKPYTGDVGIDLCAIEHTAIPAGTRKLVKTGISLRPPTGHYFQIFGRSSLALMGLDVSGGVIDCGYTGEVSVILINNCGKVAIVERGAKIAQAVPLRCAVELPLMEELDCAKSERGAKGFGSSDTDVAVPRVYFSE